MPKILLFDIETAPSLGWVWGKYEQDVIDFKQEWYILSFAAKWLGGKMMVGSLPDSPKYSKHNRENDEYVVKQLWKLFDEADIIVAHNGDQFDIKKANARFAYYKLPPPSPYKTVDTKKVAKRYFNFTSNKLDDLGRYLGYGRKMTHTGFALWQACMIGDKQAWKTMIRYNKRDVELLEKIYLHLRPWMKDHANMAMYSDKPACPKCGSHKLQSRGMAVNITTKYRRYQCQDCGGWCRGSQNIQAIKPNRNI